MNPEEEKVIWNRKLFWKIMKWIGIFLVTIFVILFVLGYWGQNIESYLLKKKAEIYFEKVEKEEQRFIELAKKDTYGGKTPEETLNLYIDALKKGDVELASKYSRVDQQEQSFKDLKFAKEKDDLIFALKFATSLKDGGKKNCTRQDYCYFLHEFITEKEETLDFGNEGDTLTVPAGSKDHYSMGFELNKYTNVWKILEP